MTDNLPEPLAKRGLDLEQWRVIERSIFPGAARESVLMAIDYCRARGLDVFKRPVHIVPIYDASANGGRGGFVDSIWPSIAELRTTAMRTHQYAGKDRVQFGPDVTEVIGDVEITYPEWAQLTVYKKLRRYDDRVAFEGDPVYWKEAYARTSKKDPTPNAMWRKRPRGQLAKNAEAAALRCAFPEEIGSDYAAEEMEGQVINAEHTVVHEKPKDRNAGVKALSDRLAQNSEKVEQEVQTEEEFMAGLEEPVPGLDDLEEEVEVETRPESS